MRPHVLRNRYPSILVEPHPAGPIVNTTVMKLAATVPSGVDSAADYQAALASITFMSS